MYLSHLTRIVAVFAFVTCFVASADDSHDDHAKPSHDEHASTHPEKSEHDENTNSEHGKKDDHAVAHPKKPNVLQKLFAEFMHKMNELQYLDEQNEILKNKVSKLEIQNLEMQHELAAKREYEKAHEIKSTALKESGSETGRTIASLNAKKTAFTIEEAFNAVAAQDYETSAKAFLWLIKDSENQTDQVYFYTGISLFHLGNYKQAIEYFERSKKLAMGRGLSSDQKVETGTNHSYAPKAIAWISLSHSKVGNVTGARIAVSELIQHYPKSREARRLNRNENFR